MNTIKFTKGTWTLQRLTDKKKKKMSYVKLYLGSET